MFDKDNDGLITPRDVGWVLRGLGQTPTEADLKQIIKDADMKGVYQVVHECDTLGLFKF